VTEGGAARHEQELKGRAFSSFFWSYGGAISGRILFFAATLVLARVLTPAQFGLVAFVLAILAYLDNLADLGVGQALVYRADGRDDDVASTAFWVGVGGSIAAIAVVCAAAPFLARIGPGHSVGLIFIVLSFTFLLRSLGSVHRYLVMHALDFRKLVLAEVLGQLTKGGLSVALAFSGAGVWSIVIGQLAGMCVWSVTLWFVTGWRPRAFVSGTHLRSLAPFGVAISFIGIAGQASHNVDYIIVGARLGAEQLGYYALAFRIPEIAILEIFMILQVTLFPYFARLKESPEDEDAKDVARLRAAYTQALRIGALLAFPLGFGMAALARPLVLVLYGHEWEPSIVPLALVAVWTSFAAIGGQPSTAYKALGRARLLTVMAVVEVGLTIPTLWFAAPYGINAVAGALVAVKVTYVAIQAVLVKRVIGIGVFTQAITILRGVVAASLMAAVVYPLGRAVPPPVALALGIPTGAVVYLATLRLFFPHDLRFLLHRVRRRRHAAAEAATQW
jgi:O-antigen/teichoic acid export membrane protein